MLVVEEKSDVQVVGSFPKKTYSVKMTPLMAKMLSSGVYEHKIRAVIRETLANAIDSHDQAGNKDLPFVHLPTIWEPWFSVVDNGLGLSLEDCENLYTTYGESTKTTQSTQIGCLGIGSKSPLSYSDSFILISRYEGTCYTFTSYKDEIGMPQLSLLTEELTDEPNGVEVRVDVKEEDIEEFEEEARFLLSFMDAETNVDLKVQKVNFQNGYAHTDKCYLVMGGVPYELKAYKVCDSKILNNISFQMEMGEFQFNPGREYVEVTPSLEEKIIAKLEVVKKDIAVVLQKQVDGCANTYEACKRLNDATAAEKEVLNSTPIMFKGKRIWGFIPLVKPLTYYAPYQRHEKNGKIDKLTFGQREVLMLEVPRTKAKARKWAKENGKFAIYVTHQDLIDNDIPASEAFEPSTIPSDPKGSRTYVSDYVPYQYLNDDGTVDDCEEPDPDDIFVVKKKGDYIFNGCTISLYALKACFTLISEDIPDGRLLLVENKRFLSKGFKSLGLKSVTQIAQSNSNKEYKYLSPHLGAKPGFYEKVFSGTKYHNEFIQYSTLTNDCQNHRRCGYKCTDLGKEFYDFLCKFHLVKHFPVSEQSKSLPFLRKYVEEC